MHKTYCVITVVQTKSMQERGVRVRILVPYNEEVEIRFKQEVEEEPARRLIYNPPVGLSHDYCLRRPMLS